MPNSPASAEVTKFSGVSGPENRANAGASAAVVFDASGPVGAGGSAAIAIGLDWSAPTLTKAASCGWTAATVAGGSVSVATTAFEGALSLLAADATGGGEFGSSSADFVWAAATGSASTTGGLCSGAASGIGATSGVAAADSGALAVGAVAAESLPEGVESESAGAVAVDGSVALPLAAAVVSVVVVTVVLAPPLACTIPSRGSTVGAAAGVEPCDDESEGEAVEIGGVAALFAPVNGESVPDPAVEFVDESDEVDDDELESDGGPDDELESEDSAGADGDAQATPGVLATAAPTPSATASAPTRPMYLAWVVVTMCSFSTVANPMGRTHR